MRSRFTLLALQRQRPGTFAMLMAATSLLMVLAAALALALRSASRDISDVTASHALIQVVDANSRRRETTADEIMTRIEHLAELGAAQRVSMKEAQALVAPYVNGVLSPELPLPAMIEVEGVDPMRLTQMFHDLPHVQVTAAGAELKPLVRLIDALRDVSFGIALIAAAATGLIAMLAARAALAREGATLKILHALGATDRQISYLITGKIARDAGIGTAVGLATALFVILTISSRISAIGAGLHPALTLGGWLTLLALPIGLIGLVILAAQGALMLALRRAQ